MGSLHCDFRTLGSPKQAGEQRDEYNPNQGYAAAGHKLFHALALSTGVVIAVAFKQVDRTPDAKTGTKGDDEGLKNADSRVEKCHNFNNRNIWVLQSRSVSRRTRPPVPIISFQIFRLIRLCKAKYVF